METTATPATRPGSKDPAAILHRAADGLRTEAITWGRGYFITPDSCRCAGGAIAWAADPSDLDGDPRYIPGALAALRLLAAHLIDTGQARCVVDADGFMDPVGTVGTWNDARDRTVGEVAAALDGAAGHVRPFGMSA